IESTGSKPAISGAMVVGYPDGSKRVIDRAPLFPATNPDQKASGSLPIGVRRPKPVITTRLFIDIPPFSRTWFLPYYGVCGMGLFPATQMKTPPSGGAGQAFVTRFSKS